MLAGYTRSGKIIFAGLCVNQNNVRLLTKNSYTLEDHYDAHCVFYFLSKATTDRKSGPEFSQHYAFLARIHKEAVVFSKQLTSPALLMRLDDSQLDEKYRRGSFLAKVTAVSQQEFR